MYKASLYSFTFVLFLTLSAKASDPSQLDCYAYELDMETKKVIQTEMKKASYDPNFLAAEMERVSFGVDTMDYEKLDALKLIITDKKSSLAATSDLSLKKQGTYRMAVQRLYIPKPNGHRYSYQIQCFEK